MTSMPAERIGLPDVVRIAPGHFADLVIFRPAAVADNTVPGRADAAPSGIGAVFISGELVCSGGAPSPPKPRSGRPLRR
jgi:N-acyl-D-amino-acid deacylase